MPSLDARLCAFAAAPFGGNMAGVVYDPVGLAADVMQRLAADLGAPTTGFVFVEVDGTGPLARLRVDDRALRDLCLEAGIDTVGVFTRLDRTGGRADVRVRDLCHGVGDPEEAASGTTNGALAALLWRRGLLRQRHAPARGAAARLGDPPVRRRRKRGPRPRLLRRHGCRGGLDRTVSHPASREDGTSGPATAGAARLAPDPAAA